jgi:hypothetical protein
MLIDIATGVRPAARLERVIADMRLQLAEVIIHHGPPLVLASGGLLTLPRPSRSYGRKLWMSPWHESAAYLPP